MTTWDLNALLGAKLDDATRVVLLHERSRSFRLFGLVEIALKVLAAIILIPFWIYLLLTSMTLGADGDGDGGESSGKPDKKRFSVSALFDYHHDLVLRVFGKDGVELHEARARVAHAEEGRRLVASVLQAAQAKGLVVVESIAEAGQGFHDPVHFWYGGRPLLSRPALRPLEELEERLRGLGFEIASDGGRHELRRVSPPPHPLAALAMLAAVVYVGFLSASLLLLPAVLFGLFLLRRHLGDFLLTLVCGLLRREERHELSVTRSQVDYAGVRGWRRTRASADAAQILGVAAYGTLSYGDGVQREPCLVQLVGTSTTAILPEAFSEGAPQLVADWIAAKLLAERESLSPVALRSRCTYCGALVDFGATPNCPACGGPFLGRTG